MRIQIGIDGLYLFSAFYLKHLNLLKMYNHIPYCQWKKFRRYLFFFKKGVSVCFMCKYILSKLFFISRIYPYLCLAVSNFTKDRGEGKSDKEYYVSLVDVPTRHKVRELTTNKIGTLVRITGQVVRTHPVHPELVLGTFLCLDCQTVIKDVEQQFKVG